MNNVATLWQNLYFENLIIRKSLPTAVIIDIDGTLSNSEHREDLKGKWDEYFNAAYKDTLYEDSKQIAEMLDNSCEIILLTGRPERIREDTLKWLADNEIAYDTLIMRPEGDKRSGVETKKDLFERYIEGKYDILFVVDDEAQNLKMFQDKGLNTLKHEH